MATPAETVVEEIALPEFERQDFVDRGYYLVAQFRDEKRRRDRAEAVQVARRHHRYDCLMTADNRLLHRNIFEWNELHLFRDLFRLIVTWATPEFFVMGYPISRDDLLRGIECFERMGSTCNPLIQRGERSYPSYFGCPRASVSLKYLHPKAWDRVFYEPAADGSSYRRPSDFFPSKEVSPAAEDVTVSDLRQISRQYCGCPLIHLPRTESLYQTLPEVLEVDKKQWKLSKDMMDTDSIQPASQRVYDDLLFDCCLDSLPSSDQPMGELACAKGTEKKVRKIDPEEERRKRLQKFTWLLEE